MSGRFELSTISRAAWDELAGHNFYASANWLDFCAVEHGATVDAVVADGDAADRLAVPLVSGGDLTGSAFDWNAELTRRSLPTLKDGFLVGACEGYRTTVLRATGQPTPEAVGRLLAGVRARAGEAACVGMYLTTEDVRLLRAAGVPAPAVLLECDAWIPVPEGGFDAWMGSLSAKRRTSVHREMAAFAAAGYRVEHVPLRECSADIAPLAISTESKYDFEATVEEDLASFRNHERCLGDSAMVALCMHDDVPVGFCLYYEWQDTVFLRWAGFDYARLRNAYEYFNVLYYEQLRRSAERKTRWLHAGVKASRAKVLRGAVLRPLWLLDLAAASPLADAAQAVHEHNAAFLDGLLDDRTLARGIADPTEWQS